MKSGEKSCTSSGPCIFISYSHKDSGRVFPVLDAMRKCGYRVCYDGMIPAGEPWTKFLAEHISDCAVFLPFLSAAFLVSGQCLKEVRFMDSTEKLVVPVWLEKLDRDSVPGEVVFLLNKAQELRLNDFPDAAEFAKHLLREPNFQPCRDVETVSARAELVTNERPVSASASFVGRADILRDIEAALRDGETIVNLYGMGGIGKSEICRKLFHDRADALSKYVGWLTWRDTLQNTLYAQFRDIREDNAERYLNLAREYVRQKGPELLIFLDNADDMNGTQAAELTRLGCRFLVTSRRQQERFRTFHAGALPPEECRILYRRALRRDGTLSDASPDTTLDEILRLAAYHTLTVELLAKTQRAAGLDAQELLDKLRESGFDLTGVEEEIEYDHRPESGGDGDGYRTFIKHMTVIFDLSRLRANALRALQGMSLFAPNEYIPVKTVKKWLDLPNLNGLNRATDAGWLNEPLDGTRAVSIHPVMVAVVRHNAPPDADYVNAVAGQLWEAMRYEYTEVFVTRLPILKHAIALYRMTRCMNLQTEYYAGMLHQIGYLNYYQGNYESALEWFQKALRIRERILGTGHPDTASTYHNIADVYWAQGNYNSALNWYQKALCIRERVLGTDHPDTTTAYNDIAVVYYELRDYDSALEWFQKALRIREHILGTEHPYTATTYHNIGQIYHEQGNYDSALKWCQKALRIRERVLGTEHPDTATTYNSIALIYDAQGDYDSALEWFQKALRIFERILGTEHPSTATIYHNIGTLYFEQGDFREAVSWLEKALAIRMKVLGLEHPNTKKTQARLDDAQERMTQEGTL